MTAAKPVPNRIGILPALAAKAGSTGTGNPSQACGGFDGTPSAASLVNMVGG
jgi:hypothetical protein